MVDKKKEFEAFWTSVKPRLRRRAAYLLEQPADIADLLQDIALFLWVRRDVWRFDDNSIPALLSLVKWRALDRHRIARKTAARDTLWAKFHLEIPISEEPATDPIPEGFAITLEELKVAVAQLPERQRLVIEGGWAGRSDSELAKELRIQPVSVRSLRRHGIARLQQLIGERRDPG